MGLDQISIGVRIRKIREELFHETRQTFAERCGISENHLGKMERGEILISMKSLDKICLKAGANADYILYGLPKNESPNKRKAIDNFLDKSSAKEIDTYFKFISLMKSFKNADN